MKENICEDKTYIRNWANHSHGVEKLIYNSGSYATFIRENYGEIIHKKEVLVRCELGSIDIDQYAKENGFARMVTNSPKYIKDWAELKEETSPTHILDIDVKGGNGWIEPKDSDEEGWEGKHYLSTHTFYGGFHKSYTKLLQSCGFNVILANWDEIGY